MFYFLSGLSVCCLWLSKVYISLYIYIYHVCSYPLQDNDYTCICLPKYTGRQCESDSPTCDDKPCGQDEFCVPLEDDTFTCEPCIDGE